MAIDDQAAEEGARYAQMEKEVRRLQAISDSSRGSLQRSQLYEEGRPGIRESLMGKIGSQSVAEAPTYVVEPRPRGLSTPRDSGTTVGSRVDRIPTADELSRMTPSQSRGNLKRALPRWTQNPNSFGLEEKRKEGIVVSSLSPSCTRMTASVRLR